MSGGHRKAWSTARKVRIGAMAALCVVLVAAGHGLGLILALGVLFWYGVGRGMFYLFDHGHRRIGRTYAEEIEKARRSEGGLGG